MRATPRAACRASCRRPPRGRREPGGAGARRTLRGVRGDRRRRHCAGAPRRRPGGNADPPAAARRGPAGPRGDARATEGARRPAPAATVARAAAGRDRRVCDRAPTRLGRRRIERQPQRQAQLHPARACAAPRRGLSRLSGNARSRRRAPGGSRATHRGAGGAGCADGNRRRPDRGGDARPCNADRPCRPRATSGAQRAALVPARTWIRRAVGGAARSDARPARARGARCPRQACPRRGASSASIAGASSCTRSPSPPSPSNGAASHC